MIILLIGKFYTEGFAQHIKETLIEMGHKVITYNYGISYEAKKSVLSYRLRQIKNALFESYRRTNFYETMQLKNLIDIIECNNPNLVINCHDILTPKQINKIKNIINIPFVLWYPDHIGLFNRAMFLNADYDYLFFKDPYIVELLKTEFGKRNVYYLPEACNPKYHFPIELNEDDIKKYSCDITTAGNLHTSRVEVFKKLVKYNCKIWGNPAPLWMTTGEINKMIMNEFVSNIEKSKAFRAAKIVLNTLQPGEIKSVNVRTFEIAAAGGFQLIPYRESLEDLFHIGSEIICYYSLEDLIEKIEYYLNRDDERSQISQRASIRALNNHTYKHRLSYILSMINQ